MKKIQLVEPYEPCLCGSGKKYKFCCYGKPSKKFHNAKESYVVIQQNKKKSEFCLHEDCNCSGKIIKSHSIQNNKILSKLSVNNHVYVAAYNAEELAGCDLKLYGKNEATTSYCFCSHHDNEIFMDIEHKNYEYTDRQNLLYAYRAFSKAYFDKIDKRNADIYEFQNCQEQVLSNKGIIDNIRGTIIDVEEFNTIKDLFNKAIDNNDYSIIETVTITLDYEIKFATSYLSPVSYDFRGNQINDPWDMAKPRKNIFVNIFPENGKSYIIVSWLKKDSKDFKLYKDQLLKLQGDKEKFYNTMNNMIACQSDNFAFSPQLIDSWDKETLESFKYEFVSFLFGTQSIKNIGIEIEKRLVDFKCKFDLFK